MSHVIFNITDREESRKLKLLFCSNQYYLAIEYTRTYIFENLIIITNNIILTKLCRTK